MQTLVSAFWLPACSLEDLVDVHLKAAKQIAYYFALLAEAYHVLVLMRISSHFRALATLYNELKRYVESP